MIADIIKKISLASPAVICADLVFAGKGIDPEEDIALINSLKSAKNVFGAGEEVAGTITIIYDHHQRELVTKLMDIQHEHGKNIISTQHIHLDHHNCMEIVAVRGSAKEAQKLADTLKAVRGVKHATLGMSSTGKHIE